MIRPTHEPFGWEEGGGGRRTNFACVSRLTLEPRIPFETVQRETIQLFFVINNPYCNTTILYYYYRTCVLLLIHCSTVARDDGWPWVPAVVARTVDVCTHGEQNANARLGEKEAVLILWRVGELPPEFVHFDGTFFFC